MFHRVPRNWQDIPRLLHGQQVFPNLSFRVQTSPLVGVGRPLRVSPPNEPFSRCWCSRPVEIPHRVVQVAGTPHSVVGKIRDSSDPRLMMHPMLACALTDMIATRRSSKSRVSCGLPLNFPNSPFPVINTFEVSSYERETSEILNGQEWLSNRSEAPPLVNHAPRSLQDVKCLGVVKPLSSKIGRKA